MRTFLVNRHNVSLLDPKLFANSFTFSDVTGELVVGLELYLEDGQVLNYPVGPIAPDGGDIIFQFNEEDHDVILRVQKAVMVRG